MKIGIGLPNCGPLARPETLVEIAKRAEALSYDGLWTADRLLYPVNPKNAYPATADGTLPEAFKRVLDPVEALTFVAAHTRTIGLGTSVLIMPYYTPVVLARRLSSLDVLSGGRLRVGLGLGWSEDEFEATNATPKNRGARADEFLQVMKALWTEEPAAFEGKYYRLPASHVGLKPVQRPHPPLYLAAYSEAGLDRIARLADGWNPAGVPAEGMRSMFEGLREMARGHGRDPDSLRLLVRGNVYLSQTPLEGERPIFAGDLSQIGDDLKACRELGTEEAFLDLSFSQEAVSLERFLKRIEQLRALMP